MKNALIYYAIIKNGIICHLTLLELGFSLFPLYPLYNYWVVDSTIIISYLEPFLDHTHN